MQHAHCLCIDVVTGIAAYLGEFANPGDEEYAPPKVHVETRVRPNEASSDAKTLMRSTAQREYPPVRLPRGALLCSGNKP